MATDDQLNIGKRGGGRPRMTHRALLTLVTGQVGVTGYSGSITAGSGGTTDGVYPLAFTGGTLATNGAPAQGNFTVVSGAVTAIAITSPGQYTSAPTGFSFVSCAGLSGAAATLTSAAAASMTWPLTGTPGQPGLPNGSRIAAIRAFNPTAITGTPTNIYVSAGVNVNDQNYVANTDVKAAGTFALTLVAAGLAALRNLTGQLTVALIANGGTNPVGTVEVEIDYTCANP